MSDKRALSAKRARRAKQPRSDEDIVDAVLRMVRAIGRRAATADPDHARLLRLVDEELAEAWRRAVAGWRADGFSDAQIGREIGVTKQAVQQRFPRDKPPLSVKARQGPASSGPHRRKAGEAPPVKPPTGGAGRNAALTGKQRPLAGNAPADRGRRPEGGRPAGPPEAGRTAGRRPPTVLADEVASPFGPQRTIWPVSLTADFVFNPRTA
jgi:hypothetical protein